MLPKGFSPPGFHLEHSCKHKQATSAYQGLADIAPRGQRLEVAAVVDQLNLWDLDGLQLLLSLTVYDMQLLHAVQQHCCPWVDPLQKRQILHVSNAFSIRAKEIASGHIPENPTGNSGRARSFVTIHGHLSTAHMPNFKGRDKEGPYGEKLLESSQKTAVDKWQSTRALILLAHRLCSSTLSIQRYQSQDNIICSQVVTTLCRFSTESQVSVSYHQMNTAKSTELRATEIHLQEN